MKSVIIIAIFGILIIGNYFISDSFAINFQDSSGYTPSWAKSMGMYQALAKCGEIDGTSTDGRWCMEWMGYVLDQGYENFPQSANSQSATNQKQTSALEALTSAKIGTTTNSPFTKYFPTKSDLDSKWKVGPVLQAEYSQEKADAAGVKEMLVQQFSRIDEYGDRFDALLMIAEYNSVNQINQGFSKSWVGIIDKVGLEKVIENNEDVDAACTGTIGVDDDWYTTQAVLICVKNQFAFVSIATSSDPVTTVLPEEGLEEISAIVAKNIKNKAALKPDLVIPNDFKFLIKSWNDDTITEAQFLQEVNKMIAKEELILPPVNELFLWRHISLPQEVHNWIRHDLVRWSDGNTKDTDPVFLLHLLLYTDPIKNIEKEFPTSERKCVENKLCAFPGDFIKRKISWSFSDEYDSYYTLVFGDYVGANKLKAYWINKDNSGLVSLPRQMTVDLNSGYVQPIDLDNPLGSDNSFSIDGITLIKGDIGDTVFSEKIKSEKSMEFNGMSRDVWVSYGTQSGTSGTLIDKNTGVKIGDEPSSDKTDLIDSLIDTNMFDNPTTIQFDGKSPVANSDETEQKSNDDETITTGGGCLIATATYGSELAPQVQQLRELRDNSLLQTESGTSFMNTFNQFYYTFSPTIADFERENPVFKEMVKIAITPMLSTLSIMTLADDSEAGVLGFGISVILLNLGIYVVGPAFGISKLRSHIQRKQTS